MARERKEGQDGGAVERVVARIVYILLMVLVIVGVLQFAGLGDAARPLAGFVDTMVQAVPKIAKAALIMLQATVAALERLALLSLAGNLTAMVQQIWTLLPTLAVSALIVVVAVFVGGLLRKLVATALRNVGFDRLMERLGFGRISQRDDRLGEFSELVAYAVQIAVILVGVAQALENLELHTWALYVNTFLAYIVQNVAVALVVVLVGFVIGGYVRDLILARSNGAAEDADDTAKWIAEFSRYLVLVFAFTMAVRQLDVAEDFVLLTFGLLFGAMCLAMALAFGLGSRDVAGEIVKKRYEQAKGKFARAAAVRPSPVGVPRPGSATVPTPRATPPVLGDDPPG